MKQMAQVLAAVTVACGMLYLLRDCRGQPSTEDVHSGILAGTNYDSSPPPPERQQPKPDVPVADNSASAN